MISLAERKQIQIEMLDEIHAFCVANGIKYSLACGTLLGAVRHKGFIPWDDDVDIMMPYPDLLRFKSLFKSKSLEYIDIDNDSTYDYVFSRIAHRKTYNKNGLIAKSYGVCIDLYIMVGIPSEFKKFETLMRLRVNMMRLKYALMKRLPIRNIPILNLLVKKCRQLYFDESPSSLAANKYYIQIGPMNLNHKMIYDRNIFHDIQDLTFEGREYKCIVDWDYYLTMLYGYYWQLPPVEQRKPSHGGEYYWKK